MKILKKLIILFSFVFSFSFLTFWETLLDEALWVDSDAWNYQIINTGVDLYFTQGESSLVVKTSKLMLKFAVIIWVIVFLIWWIRFLLSFWDDSKAKKARDNLIIAGVWILIAFMSFVILQIILSIWRSI